MPLRHTLVLGSLFLIAFSACTRNEANQSAKAKAENRVEVRSVETLLVEAGCATCLFDMQGVKGCKLAVRLEGKSFLVAGSDIDAHGDAHAVDGLCMAARQARVKGRVEGDTFVAESFVLLP